MAPWAWFIPKVASQAELHPDQNSLTVQRFVLKHISFHFISFYVISQQDGASALWIACQMGHAGCVKELLEANAEVDTAREVVSK